MSAAVPTQSPHHLLPDSIASPPLHRSLAAHVVERHYLQRAAPKPQFRCVLLNHSSRVCSVFNGEIYADTRPTCSLETYGVAKRFFDSGPGIKSNSTSSLASQRTLSGHLHSSHLPTSLQIQNARCVNRPQSFGEETQASDSSGESSPTGCCPPHGAKAVCGKRTSMEDAFAVRPDLLSVPFTQEYQQSPDVLPTRIALKYKETTESCCDISSVSMNSTSSSCTSSSSSNSSCTETFHFFGVYDGHGGSQAANHCAHRLHQHLSDSLSTYLASQSASAPSQCSSIPSQCSSVPSQCSEDPQASSIPEAGSSTQTPPIPPQQPDTCLDVDFSGDRPQGTAAPSLEAVAQLPVDTLTDCNKVEEWVASESVPDRPSPPKAVVDELACPDYECSDSFSSSPDHPCFSKVFEEALKQAFIKTDAEFGTDECSALVGSTAVVALVGGTKYCIANCGDSRAVLYRAGRAMQLTDDHKPEREDEAARVEKAGGQVLYWNGHRVMGVLAMSRAIGDHMLRPYVIAEPEVTIVSRHAEDELLLLASDGLWDVMTNQEASSLAARCLKRAQERGASRKAAARIAASVLTRAAMDRGSKDNITVVIIDLQGTGGLEGDASPTAGAATTSDASAVEVAAVAAVVAAAGPAQPADDLTAAASVEPEQPQCVQCKA